MAAPCPPSWAHDDPSVLAMQNQPLTAHSKQGFGLHQEQKKKKSLFPPIQWSEFLLVDFANVSVESTEFSQNESSKFLSSLMDLGIAEHSSDFLWFVLGPQPVMFGGQPWAQGSDLGGYQVPGMEPRSGACRAGAQVWGNPLPTVDSGTQMEWTGWRGSEGQGPCHRTEVGKGTPGRVGFVRV